MPQSIENKRDDIVLVGLFVIFLFAQLAFLISGGAWVRVDIIQFNFWMPAFVTVLATVTGIVATYSFVQYTQEGCSRSFVFTLIGMNVTLLAFLFLFTHPAAFWSAFSDRERNMTIVAALCCFVTFGALFGSFAREKSMTRQVRNTLLLWGVVIQPLVSLLLFFIPEPMFTLTSPDGGIFGLNLNGMLFSIIFGVTLFASLGRYLQEWLKKRGRITLATTLALILWALSFLIYLMIDHPLQVAELIWFSGVVEGFSLIAVAMIVTSILDPHKALESVVRERTKQLDESRKESEFYLRLWTHRIGNLLQGIITCLELIGYKAEEMEELHSLQEPAMDLVRESILVNRQIERLIRIKEQSDTITWPMNLGRILEKSMLELHETHGDKTIEVILPTIEKNVQIMADDMADIVFINLITRCARQFKGEKLKGTFDVRQTRDIVQVAFGPCEMETPLEVGEWFSAKSSLKSGTLDLESFMAWLLMDKYGGRIEYQDSPISGEKEIVLTFRKPMNSRFKRINNLSCLEESKIQLIHD